MEDELKQAILKCALGFSLTEVVEEFGMEDGAMALVKRKEIKKDVPPDLKAAQLLLSEQDYSLLSDAELEKEKKRLMGLLKEQEEEE